MLTTFSIGYLRNGLWVPLTYLRRSDTANSSWPKRYRKSQKRNRQNCCFLHSPSWKDRHEVKCYPGSRTCAKSWTRHADLLRNQKPRQTQKGWVNHLHWRHFSQRRFLPSWPDRARCSCYSRQNPRPCQQKCRQAIGLHVPCSWWSRQTSVAGLLLGRSNDNGFDE